MSLSRDFFDLNLKFARRISEVMNQSLQQSLLEYTHLYLSFGLGRDFDSENTIWQSYLHGLGKDADQAEYTYQFYLSQEEEQSKQEPDNAFGCFSYALWDGNRIRLHFRNATNVRGILQRQHIPERIAELRAMFTYVYQNVPVTSTVVGGSWLYNIEAYRRLFPGSYLESAQAGDDEFQFMALWGQFLCYDGSVRQPLAHQFLEGIKKQTTMAGLQSQFPYQVLRLESPVQDFYVHYGIESNSFSTAVEETM